MRVETGNKERRIRSVLIRSQIIIGREKNRRGTFGPEDRMGYYQVSCLAGWVVLRQLSRRIFLMDTGTNGGVTLFCEIATPPKEVVPRAT